VFGRELYKPLARLSGLLAAALLAGGLAVLVLDLGRPDRLIVAMTHYNFKSIFAWNIFLYTGFFAVVALYLWTLFERRMSGYSGRVGVAAFLWRLVLTTGTGSIFGFLVARQAYASAVLAPLFIVLSFVWGLAVFLVVQAALNAWNAIELHPAILARTRNLLGLFIVAALYLVATYHVTNLYFARQVAFERFILVDGGVLPWLFWVGYVIAGSAVPLLLIWLPRFGSARALLAASALVVAGGFALLYVFIIGGQAFPLEIFPGFAVQSAFGDGAIAHYVPSVWEALLGGGGLAAAFLITTVGVRLFDFLPHDDRRALDAASASGS
jgi:molybdopterin-containing oxidoreductase family membrane subunit